VVTHEKSKIFSYGWRLLFKNPIAGEGTRERLAGSPV